MSPSTILPPTHLYESGDTTICGFPTGLTSVPAIITDHPESVTCPLCLTVIEFQTAEAQQ